MKNFEMLTKSELDLLLNYPAYIALLAVNKDATIDEDEKKAGAKFLHIKTYSCNPLFSEFYAAADKIFESTIRKLDETLPKEKVARESAIRIELASIEEILKKMDKQISSLLHASMKSFKDHVSKAHFNVLEYFIFPVPIKGITD